MSLAIRIYISLGFSARSAGTARTFHSPIAEIPRPGISRNYVGDGGGVARSDREVVDDQKRDEGHVAKDSDPRIYSRIATANRVHARAGKKFPLPRSRRERA